MEFTCGGGDGWYIPSTNDHHIMTEVGTAVEVGMLQEWTTGVPTCLRGSGESDVSIDI